MDATLCERIRPGLTQKTKGTRQMSLDNPCDDLSPLFNLKKVSDFTQQPTAGGLINAIYYGREKYGTRPPDGYTSNLQEVIALLQSLESKESDPQMRASITGTKEYLEYLNWTVFPKLPEVMGQIIQQMINTTLTSF
jgi:hypothetical protein